MSDNNTDASPDTEAYEENETLNVNYKGRFSPNTANIKYFKDNPEILDLTDTDRIELNKNLLEPHNGEMFYDNDGYMWCCTYGQDANGQMVYNYVSKEKENADNFGYLKSQGVFNQLLSGWNNGRIYCLYLDINNHMIYPNSALVFPEEYKTYTIKRQSKVGDLTPVYVAGELIDGELNNVHISMKAVSDYTSNNVSMRMGAAMTFSSADADSDMYEPMVPNNFYVVDFYNVSGTVIDTKIFQAVESIVENASTPSQTVVDLSVKVVRAGLSMGGVNDIYPITSGEDVTSDVSFVVAAIYNDGTKKLITSEINGQQLVVEGMENVTTSSPVGSTFDVTFTYYPKETTGNTSEISKSKTITFQIVSANYTELYRVIPAIWKDTSNASIGVSGQKIFYLKTYCLNKNGVIENRSKAFYDTFTQKSQVNGVVTYIKSPLKYMYDYSKQAIMFLLDEVAETETFMFSVFSGGKSYPLTFNAKFANASVMEGFLATCEDVDYGYESTTGLLRDLENTISNVAEYNSLQRTINIKCEDGDEYFTTKYKRTINGTAVKPVVAQIYVVSDDMFNLVSENKLIQSENTELTINLKEITTSATVSFLSGEYILVKFIAGDSNNNVCTDFDTFKINTIL